MIHYLELFKIILVIGSSVPMIKSYKILRKQRIHNSIPIQSVILHYLTLTHMSLVDFKTVYASCVAKVRTKTLVIFSIQQFL